MKSPQQQDPQKAAEPVVDLDPYVSWAQGIGRSQFFLQDQQQKWVPVLLKLTEISIAEFAKGDSLFPPSPQHSQQVESFLQNVKIPREYTGSPDAGEEVDSYCMAMVAHDYFLEQIATNDLFKSRIAEVELGLPLDLESLGPEFPLK
jgi:hypothetical protein